jgi:ParB family chromosome partitioning protein
MNQGPSTPELGEDDLTPLLQATASRSLDTCLRGARGLAVLGDPRAFGLLLQLSREQDPAARVEVCRALAALDDPRAADRLRSLLFDPDAGVRDAAFTALARLESAEPLQAAGAGLSAAAEDVRRRGLEVLVRYLRGSPKDAGRAGPPLELLARALNDSSAAVRGEALKAALNLQASGGGVQTLRFVLQSVHADVRREVLTEVMAQVQHPWAWNLLLEFYNDPDPKLREETFTFAVRKNKDLAPLEAALLSQYPDVRRLAVDALIKKHTAPAQALLARTLADPDNDVRQLALAALVGDDARQPLTEALTSPHADVRVRAACALARHGETAALAPLLALATAPEPPQRERQADWLALAGAALEGLAELGDASAMAPLVPLLRSPHALLRSRAAQALAWTALPHHHETLRQALQHDDPQVKYRAALGLASAGDPLVAALVFSTPANGVLTRDAQLVAAFALGPAGEDRLALFLDDADEALRSRALVLLMLLELKASRGAPARCLTCLSARSPRIRLAAARAVEQLADSEAFRDYIVHLVNDRGDQPPWKITAETIETLADLLAYGSPTARARTADLLRHLAAKEPAAWEQSWALHADRYAAEIRALREAAPERQPPAPQYSREQLDDLAFGAYVGLVREQGGSTTAGYGSEAQVVRVRQTALVRIQEMATKRGKRAAALPVLVQALADPNQAVRLQAFDQLAALGMDAPSLGAAALGTGHTDVGVRGLEKLAGGGTSAEGQAVLEEALRTRGDDLATEAAKLLAARRGLVPVAGLALGAAHEPLRRQAVDWLAAEYDRDPAARELLRQALQSRHRKVTTAAAFALAGKKDAAAFDALVRLLREAQEESAQRRLIEALQELGDPRTADAFLDRIEQDATGTALVDELFDAAGSCRRPETADRLLAMAESEKWRKALWAAYIVSGFDQPIEDPEDEKPDRRWEQKQFPRHDAILARLLRRAAELKANGALEEFLPAARWARGGDEDPALAELTVHAAEDVRHAAVEAVGWRLRKRGGPAEPLVKALKHRDPVTQLLAAEGLARGGREEGLSTLLAAVDLQTGALLLRRAVHAIGALGDPRALDLLLKIVNDPEHELRDEAAEALGHMGRASRAHELLDPLLNLARGSGPVARGAVRGLRWFDHPEGWQLIRRRAADPSSDLRQEAIEMLGNNDDPSTRDLLLRLLGQEPNPWALEAIVASARKLWGEDSLEPDCAVLRNPQLGAEERDALFRRLQERGDPRRMLEILPKLYPEAAMQLERILLRRQPLPVAEALAILAGADPVAVCVAAHLLDRAGAPEAGPPVAAALARWWGGWDRARREETRHGAGDGSMSGPLLDAVWGLIGAAGRLGVAADLLMTIATTRTDVPFDRLVRREAVAVLAAGTLGPNGLAVLMLLTTDDDPEIRTTAAAAVVRVDPSRAAEVAGHVLADRPALDRLARPGVSLGEVLRKAAREVHYQGIAVPHLADGRDVPGLVAVATDRSLPEETRLGAVEGLAAAGGREAVARLEEIGRSLQEPEELRKAAWRGRRRAQRAARKEAAT